MTDVFWRFVLANPWSWIGPLWIGFLGLAVLVIWQAARAVETPTRDFTRRTPEPRRLRVLPRPFDQDAPYTHHQGA